MLEKLFNFEVETNRAGISFADVCSSSIPQVFYRM